MCEFREVRGVSKICNSMKIEPQHERLPRKFPQRISPGPRLSYELLFENTFFLITPVRLKISEFLYMETLG